MLIFVLILIGLIFGSALFWIHTSGEIVEGKGTKEDQIDNDEETYTAGELTKAEEVLLDLFEYLYLEGECSLDRTINWLKASQDPDEAEKITAEDSLGKDLTVLIRKVVLAGDILRSLDADFLINAAHFLHLNNFRNQTAATALRLLERYRLSEDEAKWSVPTILGLREKQDLPRMIDIYTGIAEHIANHPEESVRLRRQVGLEAVKEELKELLVESTTGEHVDPMRDMRLELLGVSPDHSPEDLKAAYHRAAALWHPDKLAHLAPELRSHAEVQMKAINEAYQSLQAELEGNSI